MNVKRGRLLAWPGPSIPMNGASGFSFFRGVGIPAFGAEFIPLSIAELYRRPGGTVNNRENRVRRSYPDKKSLRRG
jgi:hypothetical protein